MSSAEQITTTDIKEYLSKFDDLGGVIDFKFFKVIGTTSDIDAHLVTANRALELLGLDNDAYFNKVAQSLDTNRDSYFKVASKSISSDTATLITPEEFFGPYF